jgi:hypothetical protein
MDWLSLLDTERGKDTKCGAGRFEDGSDYLRQEGHRAKANSSCCQADEDLEGNLGGNSPWKSL